MQALRMPLHIGIEHRTGSLVRPCVHGASRPRVNKTGTHALDHHLRELLSRAAEQTNVATFVSLGFASSMLKEVAMTVGSH